MKKNLLALGIVLVGVTAVAQVPRKTLFEEFTGENCAPCASTNPGLNVILAANPNVIPIKWQVPIPSAPSATWSLYQTNITEINWRYQGAGYGYQSQNTATNAITNGINSAPSGRFDGQHQWTFGATSDHPAYVSNTVINAAASATTPFSIAMNATWDNTFTNAVVSVTVTAASAFTSSAALVYRLCLIERKINFASAPGTNGEKDFEDVVRKSYPSIQAGTSLPTTWTPGQSQTFTIACAAPSYIVNKGEQAFVGFIQDDGNKKVWQAYRTPKPSIPNDAALNTLNINQGLSCATNFTPTVNVVNNGPTAITAMTLVPYINGLAQAPINWTGSIAGLGNTNISLNSYTAANGSNTFSVNITNVLGGDIVTSNNSKQLLFGVANTYYGGAVVEPFTLVSFPPVNWFMLNPDAGVYTWKKSTTVGNGGVGSAQYDFYNNASVGDIDELYIKPLDFTGVATPTLSFDHAYTSYSSNEVDGLEVKVSTNCGTTWTTVFSKFGPALYTAPVTTGTFVPSASNWTTNVINLPTAANQAQVLVKFVATNDFGNMLYIDNVNLNASLTTSIKSSTTNDFNVELFPNPSSEFTNLNVTTQSATSAKILVYSIIGQLVSEKAVTLTEGFNNIVIDTKTLSSGVYNVILSTNSGNTVKKLTVNK